MGAALRRLVEVRAERLCEYCLIHEENTVFGCELDHIVSEKHGGPTREDNLAYSCLVCNRNKGSDIASLEPGTGQLVRLFNPRLDHWAEHFELAEDGFTILARTVIGEVTSRILRFDHPDRLLEREALRDVGLYPTAAARRRVQGAG